jgi:uroporphyrinogen-III decarboxylase
MRLPDIQSPFDIAALIWEKSDFFAALYTEPEAVKELVAMAEELLSEFLDKWFARYGTEFAAHYPTYYMPSGITLSEDEIGALSPEMVREFSLPVLNRLSGRYGQIGIHCCAHAVHQWGNLAGINNLTVLNLIQPDDVIEKAYPFFSGVCAQMHNAEGPYKCPDPEARIIYQGQAATTEEAVEKAARLRKL